MTSESEGNLQFHFPDEWPVLRYDACGFYRDRVEKCQDVKAVDFLLLARTGLVMIEVTDFRDFRIQTKLSLKNDGLAREFAAKVKDTIAGLYGAHRNENEDLAPFCNYLFLQRPRKVKVILLLEEDRPPSGHKSFKAIRSNLIMAINRRLRYLSVRCNVHCRRDVPSDYGWSVT
ncbi:MAG: hypothetical protein V2B18_20670 [Pseudomonadota bacterium]